MLFQSAHLDFIVAAANLRAFNFSIPTNRDRDFIKAQVASVSVPAFKPRSGQNLIVINIPYFDYTVLKPSPP